MRTKFVTFPQINYAPDGGSDGGGQQQQDPNPQQQQDNRQQQQQDQNNIDPSVAELEQLWQTEDNSNKDKEQQQQQPQQLSANEVQQQFQQHVASLKLAEGVDTDKIKEGLNAGDVSPLVAAMEGVAGKVYQSAVVASNKLFESKIEKAVAQAVEKSTGKVSADFAVTEMQKAIPFTKKPEISPVAIAVLRQFMNKGNDQATSIQKTKDFLTHFFKAGAKDLGISIAPKGKPSGNGFQGSFMETEISDGDDDGGIDFESLFAPK